MLKPHHDLPASNMILFYDQNCCLCQNFASKIQKKAPPQLRLSPLNSPLAKQCLLPLAPNLNSVVLYLMPTQQQPASQLLHSEAILTVLDQLNTRWLTHWMWYVPALVRNGVYRLIARYRQRFSCWFC